MSGEMPAHIEQEQGKERRSLRVDPALVIAAGLGSGALACVAPALTFGLAALCLALFATRLRRCELLLAGLAVLGGALRAQLALGTFETERERARALVPSPSRCAIVGRVVSSPALRAGMLHFDADLRELDCDDGSTEQALRARLSGGPRDLARGDEFRAVVNLSPVSSFRNFLLPDPRPSAARQGAVLRGALLSFEVSRHSRSLGARIDHLRARVRARIQATFAEPVQGMARALVLGETDLALEDDAAFKKSGLSHLLAVSGTHLVLAVLGVLRVLEALARRIEALSARTSVRRPVALVGALLAPLYADFSGGSGSAWRAAFMLVAVLGVRALGRHALTSRVVAASIVLGWSSDALVIFDPSFLLSLAATLGLASFGGVCSTGRQTSLDLSEPRAPNALRMLRRVSDGALTTLSASLPCMPLLLLLAPGLSLASLAANLLAAPLGEIVALPLCLVHALLGPWPPIERAVALAASGALATIREIARLGAAIDWLYIEIPVPGPWHLATLVLGLAGFVALRSVRWLGSAERAAPPWVPPTWMASAWLGLAALALVFVEWRTVSVHSAAWHRERHLLVVTALDVGQGDATLIDLPDGRLALIDGGGLPGSTLDIGVRVLLPVLRARRRSHLDLVVLTHLHPDHFGGLLSLLDSVSVGEFWYAGERGSAGEGTSPVAEMVRRLSARGVRIRSAPELCGDQSLVPPGAGFGIDVLGPCPDLEPGASENDNSLVLRIHAGERSALFVGDAERSAEQRLLESGRTLGSDFLKVGHHGSRSSSTPEFIARVHPRVASISAGLGNRFGHPHSETLATLAAAGVLTLRLDELGSVVWQSDGQQQSIRTFLPVARRDGATLPAAAAAAGGSGAVSKWEANTGPRFARARHWAPNRVMFAA